jgi:hypothetical protein
MEAERKRRFLRIHPVAVFSIGVTAGLASMNYEVRDKDMEPFESIEDGVRWFEGHLIERASFRAVILGHVRRVLFTPVGVFVL